MSSPKTGVCRWCEKTIYYDRETRLYYAEVVSVDSTARVQINYYCPKDMNSERCEHVPAREAAL